MALVGGLVGGAAVVLAACSGAGGQGDGSATTTGASPSGAASASVSAEPTAAPSSTLRPLPAEATELSEAGAVAFLEWWVEMYNHVEATGETELVFQHSEPGCTFCQNFVERVDPVYAAGGRIEREAPTRFLDVVPSAPDSNSYVVVTLNISSSTSRSFARDGRLLSTVPGEDPFPVAVGLQWTGSQWSLTDVQLEEV